MKKTNIITVILAIVCCISLAISGTCLSYVVTHTKQIAHLEKANDNVYGCQYIDAEFEKLDLSGFNFEIGERTTWYEAPVRFASVEAHDGVLVLPAGTRLKVIFAYNLTVDAKNADFYVDRSYKIENTEEAAWAILVGVEGVPALCEIFAN